MPSHAVQQIGVGEKSASISRTRARFKDKLDILGIVLIIQIFAFYFGREMPNKVEKSGANH